MKLKYVIDKNCVVKEYLKEVGLSHHLLKKVRTLDNIFINGQVGKNYYMLNKGDILELEFNEELNDDIIAVDKDLKILYEDDYFLIVRKESYISSMPSKRHQTDNLLSIVKNHFIKCGVNGNMHLVNRLDYQTSGLIIIAKDGIIHYELEKIDIIKKYLCVVSGIIDNKNNNGETYTKIELPISREKQPSILRYVDLENGSNAITLYKVLSMDYKNNTSLVEVQLVTGRTHQIRVHFSYLGYPLIGDKLYNNNCDDNELLLHAYYLEFIHPITKEKIKVVDYPEWIKNYKL